MKIYLSFIQVILILFISSTSFAITLNDNGQMSATDVSHVVHVKSDTDILKAIQEANSEHIPVTIMGKQHSQKSWMQINRNEESAILFKKD